MRVLIIGGTGFIGAHIVRMLASHEHAVAIYHRGKTHAVVPDQVKQIIEPRPSMPLLRFPEELFAFRPEVVILTITMGAADASAAAEAFAGRTGRIVLLSSGDVYRAYGRLLGIEKAPIQTGGDSRETLKSRVSPVGCHSSRVLIRLFSKLKIRAIARDRRPTVGSGCREKALFESPFFRLVEVFPGRLGQRRISAHNVTNHLPCRQIQRSLRRRSHRQRHRALRAKADTLCR